MPIFARRRIQSMLDDIKSKIQTKEENDLLSRLKNKRQKQALPAEAELALLWALDQTCLIDIWPELPGLSCRIEAIAHDLFVSKPAAIEITAISDYSFSGKEAMNQVAEKFVSFANSLRKNSGKHLFFEFAESSWNENGNTKRVRHVISNYALKKSDKVILEDWLKKTDWPNPYQIKIKNEDLNVTIRWKDYVHVESRTFCTMPAMTYDLEKNHLFKAMETKDKEQLSQFPDNYLRCLFVADAGCNVLKNLKGFKSIGEKSGEEIINHFLSKSRIDIICVFSPYRQSQIGVFNINSYKELMWKVTVFEGRSSCPENEYKGLEKVASILPKPRFEGYQAHSLHRQGAFHHQSNKWYLGTNITTKGKSAAMTIKVSSRLVLDLLAGKITHEYFHQMAFGNNHNQFAHELKQGFTINSASLDPAGIDEDDDFLILEMSPDPAASSFH